LHFSSKEEEMQKTQWIVRVALLVAAAGASAGGVQAQTPQRVEALTRQAEVVFRGTVERVAAANLSVVEPAADTAVVRIDELLKAPADVRDFVGREVTVKLRTPDSVKPGTKAVFFATTWLYGESLGLVEVGRVRDSGPGLRTEVAAASRRIYEDEVRQHIAGAALVVAGKVVETRPAPPSAQRSEHDPNWWEAVIRVDSVIKGQAAEHIVLLYPHSMDVMWFNAPKPQVGWDAVWLLSAAEGELMRGRAGVYTALEPWRIMSRDDAGLVRRLVRP
jgi:hypothetical protein